MLFSGCKGSRLVALNCSGGRAERLNGGLFGLFELFWYFFIRMVQIVGTLTYMLVIASCHFRFTVKFLNVSLLGKNSIMFRTFKRIKYK